MKEKLKVRGFLVFYVIGMVSGGLCLPVFLIWPLFFDGQWIGFFISLVVLLVAMSIAERIHKSIAPPVLKLSNLMIDCPHGVIGWMWFVTLGNTLFHFGKALFFDGSWSVWLGSLVLSGFVKAALRQAVAQDNLDRKNFLEAEFKKTLLLAEKGDSVAQNDLGAMYAQGQGVAQDYSEAAKWYRLSAEQGQEIAQSNLGNMYDQGQGVPQDYTEALKWFRLAAEQGDDQAQFNLYIMYDKGQGVPQNVVLAHMWVNLAAAQGVERAIKSLIKLEERMTKEQLAEAQRLAREWKPKGK